MRIGSVVQWHCTSPSWQVPVRADPITRELASFQAYPLRQALAMSSGRKCPDWPERAGDQGDGGQIIAEPGTAASRELVEGVTARAVGVIADARPRPFMTRYVLLVRFSFLILIGRFATLEL
jgi:hypothetical protein